MGYGEFSDYINNYVEPTTIIGTESPLHLLEKELGAIFFAVGIPEEQRQLQRKADELHEQDPQANPDVEFIWERFRSEKGELPTVQGWIFKRMRKVN